MQTSKGQIARDIVDSLIDDLADRKGFGDDWARCDYDIREEIKGEWQGRILAVLEDAGL